MGAPPELTDWPMTHRQKQDARGGLQSFLGALGGFYGLFGKFSVVSSTRPGPLGHKPHARVAARTCSWRPSPAVGRLTGRMTG
jgi:hypothetical protein